MEFHILKSWTALDFDRPSICLWNHYEHFHHVVFASVSTHATTRKKVLLHLNILGRDTIFHVLPIIGFTWLRLKRKECNFQVSELDEKNLGICLNLRSCITLCGSQAHILPESSNQRMELIFIRAILHLVCTNWWF